MEKYKNLSPRESDTIIEIPKALTHTPTSKNIVETTQEVKK